MDTDALQRLDSFLSDPQVPQEDKNRAVAMARTQEQSAEPAPIQSSEARARSGSYLYNKANQFVGALQGVGKDVENVVTGQPYGTGFPGERTGWQTASDALTTAAPIMAPELTAAGLGAGTLARAGGYSEPTADEINAGIQLGIGGGQTILSAGKAVAEAPAALKAASQAKYAEAASGAKGYISASDPFVQSLSDALESNLTHPAERAMATPLLNKATTPGSPGLNYADLDNALAGLRKIRGPSYVRGLIDDAAQSLVEGTPAGTARTAAKGLYRSLKAKPFKLAGGLTGGIVGANLAAKDIASGNYKRAALAAGAGIVAGAGLGKLTGRGMLTAAQGAAGPLAQTAVGVGSQIPGLVGAGDAENAPASPTEPDTAPAAPDEAPSPSQAIKPLPGPYGRELAAVASLVGVPAPLLQGVMQQESGGNPNALSHPAADQAQTPAHGLMQITPGTFASVAPQVRDLTGQKPDLSNPLHNILASGLLWRKYLDRAQGDVTIAAKMYHGGEGTQAWGPRTEQYGEDIGRRYAAEGGG